MSDIFGRSPQFTTEEVFKKYEMGEILGKGSSAHVYSATSLKNGDMVAFKLYFEKPDATQEVVFLSSLRTKNSCRRYLPCLEDYFRWDTGDGDIYFVVVEEKLNGVELSALPLAEMNFTRRGQRELGNIMLNAAEALQYVHSVSLIHNDIKPENMMYDVRSERAIMLDFGGACAAVDTRMVRRGLIRAKKRMSVEAERFQKTLLETIMQNNEEGAFELMSRYRCRRRDRVYTPYFVAPDLYVYAASPTDKDLDDEAFFNLLRKGDVFSLGATFYYLLTNGKFVVDKAPRDWTQNDVDRILSRESLLPTRFTSGNKKMDELLRSMLFTRATRRPTAKATYETLKSIYGK